MKKFSLLLAGVLPALMLGACASTDGNHDSATGVAAGIAEEAPTTHFDQFRAGRNPADYSSLDCSDSSFTTDPSSVDPAAHWEDGSFIVGFNVNGGRADKVVEMNQVVSIKKQYSCNDTCYRWVAQKSDDQGWDDYSTCNATGSGQSDLWNAFYSAPKDEKAKKLDKAIKGIGESNAQKLVDHKAFEPKPRSWGDFVRAVRGAQSYLTPGIAEQVTSTYAIDNIQNLGYDSNSCAPVHHPEHHTVYTQVAYSCPGTRFAVEQSQISKAYLPIVVNIGPAILQSFEGDRVGVNVGFDGQRFILRDAHASTLNSFNFSEPNGGQPFYFQPGASPVPVSFTERGRILVDLPSDIVGNVTLDSAQRAVLFNVPVNLGQRRPSGPADQMVVSYSVEQCDLAGHIWTLGIRTCGKWYTIAAMHDVPLRDGANLVQTIPSDADHKIQVTYRISRRNSRYYNSTALPARSLTAKAHK